MDELKGSTQIFTRQIPLEESGILGWLLSHERVRAQTFWSTEREMWVNFDCQWLFQYFEKFSKM